MCVASPDLIEARTGHSMACGLARLGAKVTLASPSARRIPEAVRKEIKQFGVTYEEALDLDQGGFNDLVSGMDMIYLPGCSAPKGAEAETFKKSMDDYLVRFETLDNVRRTKGTYYLHHSHPAAPGRGDGSAHRQLARPALF